jgi:hypothetical protein
MKRALLCALVVVMAGCAVPVAPSGESDPGTDRLGWENGYWYDDPLPVNTTDGLDERERDAVVSRQMARLEHLRGLEFESDVDLRVISRAEYRRNRGGGTDETHSLWNGQVWEGLFLVGEETSVDEAFNSTLGSSVLGYYQAGTDELVIVSDSAEPTIDRGTLVHELVHALQDQQFGLGNAPDTQDRQLARNGVVEGEANLLERRYQQRCETSWDCVETPPRGGGNGGSVNRGILLIVLAPYTSGPEFVATVERRGGWSAVNDLHRELPVSTAQLVDPGKYPDVTPVEVTVPDRSDTDWSRFDHDPVADTVGQASIHAMFVENGVRTGSVGRYSYDHPAADGWAGDTLVPYRNGDRYGYVWETAWETDGEARRFAEAYRELLDARGAETRDGAAVIPEDSPFGDAFRVTRDGRRVRVVNGPAVESLSAIHGS